MLMKVCLSLSPGCQASAHCPHRSLGSKCQASERGPLGRSGQVQSRPQRPRARPAIPGGVASGTGAAGLGNPRQIPGPICPRQPQPRAPRPARRARTRALLTAGGCAGRARRARQARPGARRSSLLSGRPPARGAAEEPRGRSGLPGPRRRLEALPAAPGRDSGRPLLGAPSGQPRGEGRQPSTRSGDTSRSQGREPGARPSRRPYRL